MARESKRRRDEKRFGKAERLADRILHADRMIPGAFTDNVDPPDRISVHEWQKCVDALVVEANKSTVVIAGNVVDYFCGAFQSKHFDWSKDLPSITPPFPSMFVEMDFPGTGLPGFPETMRPPKSWGLVVNLLGSDGVPVPGSSSKQSVILDRRNTPERYQSVWSTLIEEETAGIDAGRFNCGMIIDDFGRIVGEPVFGMVFGERATRQFREIEIERFKALAAPAFLAIAFMHFKGIVVTPVEPHVGFNRERKKAGLRPFVRYHTINIEPAKQVLRTVGNIEANGLKKALHIARGHFATYADNFMGRPLDKPLTVWRPAHVRGSLDKGLVVSDYKVNAPQAPEPAK